MQTDRSALDTLIDAARGLTPSKFISWLEDMNPKREKKLEIDILNRDEILNINRDPLRLKVDQWIFIFDNGVFQRVEQ